MAIPKSSDSTDFPNPDEFSRGTVQLTFKVLRHAYPSLALNVRNLLGEHANQLRHKKLTDKIQVTLNEKQIEKIVAALYKIEAELQRDEPAQDGSVMLLKLLIHEWGSLDDWLFTRSNYVMHGTHQFH